MKALSFVLLFSLCSVFSAPAQNLDVVLDVGRGPETVHLKQQSVFAPGSEIQVITAKGPVNVDPGSIRVYRGALPSDPNSIVALAHTTAGVIGSILTDNGRFEVRREPLVTAPYVVSRSQRGAGSCHLQDAIVPEDVLRLLNDKSDEQTQDTDPLSLQLAIEADYTLFAAYQSREATTAYIASVIATTSTIYERDLNTSVAISNIRLFEDQNNPYADMNMSLGELREKFSILYQDEMTHVPRHAAMLMTRRGGLGGIASGVGVMCAENASYAVADVNGNWFDEIVVAHELGHLCGGLHTQDCLWPGGPLDSCVASDFGTCVTEAMTRPIVGTIMSYCHLRSNEGGMVQPVFHARHKRFLRTYLERSLCVGARASKYDNILRGRLIHAGTGEGLSGVSLRLKLFVDIPMTPQPELGPDVLCTTDENGAFQFTGLADALYSVVVPDEYVLETPSIVEQRNEMNTIVSDDTVYQEIRALPGARQKVIMHGPVANMFVAFFRVSDALPELHDVYMEMNTETATGAELEMNLRAGSYTLMPYLRGVRFSPERATMHVGATPAQPVEFTAEVMATPFTAAVAAITAVVENGRLRLCAGDTMRMIPTVGDSRVAITDEFGLAFFSEVPEFSEFTLHHGYDQQTWVGTTQNDVPGAAYGPAPVVFAKRRLDTSVSVEDEFESNDMDRGRGLHVFPNPVTDVLTIRGIQSNASLAILDALGRTLYRIESAQPTAQIDVSGVASGRYTLVVNDQFGTLTRMLTIAR